MKSLKYIIMAFLLGILTISISLPFMGFNYFTNTITSLGFFTNSRFVHDVLAFCMFIIAPIIVGIFMIKENLNIFGVLNIISTVVYLITILPIFQWLSFWAICAYFGNNL